MEANGLVHREVYAKVPPRVEYSLTELGKSLKPILDSMWAWGEEYASVDMTMESFCTMYEEDIRPSLKQSTWLTTENIIQKKILPYLGK